MPSQPKRQNLFPPHPAKRKRVGARGYEFEIIGLPAFAFAQLWRDKPAFSSFREEREKKPPQAELGAS